MWKEDRSAFGLSIAKKTQYAQLHDARIYPFIVSRSRTDHYGRRCRSLLRGTAVLSTGEWHMKSGLGRPIGQKL